MLALHEALVVCSSVHDTSTFGHCLTAGAHNTIVTARAGKDLVSCLVSGLLTIGPRFGGAVDDAARYFQDACDRGKTHLVVVGSQCHIQCNCVSKVAGSSGLQARCTNACSDEVVCLRGKQFLNS